MERLKYFKGAMNTVTKNINNYMEENEKDGYIVSIFSFDWINKDPVNAQVLITFKLIEDKNKKKSKNEIGFQPKKVELKGDK